MKPEVLEALKALASEITSLDSECSESDVQSAFEGMLARFNLKLGQLAQPFRMALAGGTVSPGIYEVIAVLGAKRSVTRLQKAVRRIEESDPAMTSH